MLPDLESHTNKVYVSIDVVFLNRIFYEKPDGPFLSIVKTLPEVEGVGEIDASGDDTEKETMIEEE